jgi:hypothetical protein
MSSLAALKTQLASWGTEKVIWDSCEFIDCLEESVGFKRNWESDLRQLSVHRGPCRLTWLHEELREWSETVVSSSSALKNQLASRGIERMIWDSCESVECLEGSVSSVRNWVSDLRQLWVRWVPWTISWFREESREWSETVVSSLGALKNQLASRGIERVIWDRYEFVECLERSVGFMRNWESDLRQLSVHRVPWRISWLQEELREWSEIVVSPLSALKAQLASWGVERVIWDSCAFVECLERSVGFMRNWESDLRQLWVHRVPWTISWLHEELREWSETVVSSLSALNDQSASCGIERVIWDKCGFIECLERSVGLMRNWESDLRQLWVRWVPRRLRWLREELREWSKTVVSSLSALNDQSASWGIEKVIWDSCESVECLEGSAGFVRNWESDLRQLCVH